MKHSLHTIVQGVFFMCRKNQLLGSVLIAFGLGLLIGIRLEGGFLCHCVCFGVIAVGGGLLRRW